MFVGVVVSFLVEVDLMLSVLFESGEEGVDKVLVGVGI